MAKKTVFDWDKFLAQRAKVFRVTLRKAMIVAKLVGVGAAKKNATTGPRVRSGRLRASIRGVVRKGSKGPELALQAGGKKGVSYAAQREYGGTITPTSSRYLTIPLPAALTGAGVPRYPSARSVPDSFFLRTPGGKLLIMQKIPGGMQPMYWLAQSVTQKAQPYLRPALEVALKSLRPELAAAVTSSVLPS